jgi:hypothetical protein
MKKTILSLAVAAVAASFALADEVRTTTTTTTGAGTITEYSPGKTFIVKEHSGPVTYHYGKHVTYVSHGKDLSDEEVRTRVKVGAPVHVHYSTEGHDRVIDRVELDE